MPRPPLDRFDEPTPLPPAPGIEADPYFPTGRLPRIDAGTTDLYPRWILDSLCESADELGTLLAPYLEDDTALVVHSTPAPDAGRVVLELRCAGEPTLVGVADIVSVDGPHDRPALRASFVSIDPLSGELFDAMNAERRALRDAEVAACEHRTRRMFGLPNDHATHRMDRRDLAVLMGATAEQVAGWDNRLLFTARPAAPTGASRASASFTAPRQLPPVESAVPDSPPVDAGRRPHHRGWPLAVPWWTAAAAVGAVCLLGWLLGA